jgi:hypothetical protein
MGMGAAYLYLFVLWAAVILVFFLAARRIGASGAGDPGGDDP